MIAHNDKARIVFGCGNFGGLGSSPSLRDKGDARETALALLDHARALGLTRFDTANTYGGGASETILGEWLGLQGSAYRQAIQVASKVGNPNGTPPGEHPLSRGQVAFHLEQSLQRLGVERIDLYYLHEFEAVTPLEETLEAIDRALEAGKIAGFGISNAAIGHLEAVLRICGNGPLRRAFAAVQNQFNLLDEGDLDAVIPLARAEGLEYVAFSPLAGGLLSGKYRQGQPGAPGARLGDAPQFFEGLLTPQTFQAIEDLRERASSLGWTIPGAALRFILDRPEHLSLIVAPRSLAQFDGYGIAL